MALSRVTGREGLLLSGPQIQKEAIRAHDKVRNFYDMLERGYGGGGAEGVVAADGGTLDDDYDELEVVEMVQPPKRKREERFNEEEKRDKRVRTCGHCTLDNEWTANVCVCCGNVILTC